MPTSEQIEKAARAICVAIGLQPDECTFGSGGIVHGGNSTFTCHRYRWQEFTAHATAVISAAEGVKPRVKPLEWKKGPTAETASTSVGTYSVWRDEDVVFLRQPRLYHGSPFDGTIEDAKSFAQQHFERAILSALEGQ